MRRSNTLFMLSDQQRWDTCGCYGQPLDIRSNLDRMAGEDVRFERAFTSQPVCGPARSCLQIGRYATETGCIRNDIALPLDEKTIAHYLSDGGYEVGYIQMEAQRAPHGRGAGSHLVMCMWRSPCTFSRVTRTNAPIWSGPQDVGKNTRTGDSRGG